MNTFKKALDAFLRGEHNNPPWDKHIPDELYALIQTEGDFLEFLKFVAYNENPDLIEYGCDDVGTFLKRIVETQTNPVDLSYASTKGMTGGYGFLAYSIVLALGNE